MEIVANTINSKDEHLVEYVSEKDNVSNKAIDAFGIPSYLDKDKMQEKFGGIPASIYAAGGGSVTGKTKKGTLSLMVSGALGLQITKMQMVIMSQVQLVGRERRNMKYLDMEDRL